MTPVGITYAGVPLRTTADPARLPDGVEAVQDWVERVVSPLDAAEWTPRLWPGRNLTHLGWRGGGQTPPVRVGSFRWPWGASRWAVAHFLATEEDTERCRQVTQSGAGYHAETLTLTDGIGGTVSTLMWLLPARPLAQVGAPGKLNLLTLVDERFFWWKKAAAVSVTGGTTTWAQLYSAIGSALGVTITADAISASYLKPSAALTARYEALPVLLDAVCASVGQRLVRRLDGTVLAQGPAAARTSAEAGLAAHAARMAGGRFALAVA